MKTGLEGKVVLITGAGRNIGRETALQMAKEGADLVLCTRKSKQSLEDTAHEVSACGVRVVTCLCDVSQSEQVDRLMKKADAEFGRVDVLVNNAVYRVGHPLLETEIDEWHDAIGVKLTGPYLTCRAVLPGMIERRWGRIINYSGLGGYRGQGAGKATVNMGTIGLTRAIAREYSRYDVTTNCIIPGIIEVTRDPGQERKLAPEQIQELSMPRFGESAEVASLVVYLASESAAYITGQCIGINGGYYFH
ncbi:SDR family NAD(P)-dependent oxidoreductase [Chloroflexota bacterium]